jgi:RND family efflux transporter MFP subunit
MRQLSKRCLVSFCAGLGFITILTQSVLLNADQQDERDVRHSLPSRPAVATSGNFATTHTGRLKSDTTESAAVVMLPGIVAARHGITLSVPMNGILYRLHVHEGDRVTAGQPIAAMDDRIAAASVRLAEVQASQDAAIIQAQLQKLQAERFLSRVQNANAASAASELELDEAQAALDSACQSLKQAHERHQQARAQLELERAKLASHQIVAPFDGSVSRIAASPGQTMNTSEPLLQILDVRQLKVELHVPSTHFGLLRRGSQYQLEAGTPVNSRITATLQSTEMMIDAGTNTFRCTFLIDNEDEKMPTGFLVRLIEPAESPATQTAHRTTD